MQSISPGSVYLSPDLKGILRSQKWFRPRIVTRNHGSHEFCSCSQQKRAGRISLEPFRKRSMQQMPVRWESKGEFGRSLWGVTLHNTTLDCSTLFVQIPHICQWMSNHHLLRWIFQGGGDKICSLSIRVA